jgi:hypothetical protein
MTDIFEIRDAENLHDMDAGLRVRPEWRAAIEHEKQLQLWAYHHFRVRRRNHRIAALFLLGILLAAAVALIVGVLS